MKKSGFIIYFLTGIGMLVLIAAGFSFKDIDEYDEPVEVKADGRLQYKWYVPETPKAMTFAGEKVPLDRWEIREQLEREMLINYYSPVNVLHIVRQGSRYFPMIEKKLKENGIPDDFKYLCAAESSLINQTSRVGAVGFWQFMKDTAPTYGLEVNDQVDERYHVAKSTDAACKYLKQAYDKFGTWTAAAASYNCGMGGYSGQATFQQTKYYYDLLLPDESMRYVFRILTLKYYISGAEKLGFIIQKKDAYKPYNTKTVVVTDSIPDLAQYAIDNRTTYKMLKLYNPWLRARNLPVKSGASYELELPQ